jgi:hypothetical protein
VVVDDRNVGGTGLGASEAKPVLIGDANAVQPCTVTAQCLQTVCSGCGVIDRAAVALPFALSGSAYTVDVVA